MRRKYIIVILAVLLLGFFATLFAINKEITFYFIIGDTQSENVDVGLVVNNNYIFKDSLLNHRYEIKIVEKELRGGFCNVKLYSSNSLLYEEDLFIIFQKHIVIEYNDNCSGNNPCFDVSKRYKPFLLE